MEETYFALNCYMSKYCFIKPSQIDKHLEDPFHVYFILSEDKSYFVEGSISICNRYMSCQIERNGTILNLKKVLIPELDGGVITVRSTSLSKDKSTLMVRYLRSFCSEGEFVLTANNAYKQSGLCLKLVCDVLYIGQSFGGDGHRTAGCRLSSHSTLQKIQSDVADRGGDVEVTCLLADFELDTMLVVPPTKDADATMNKFWNFYEAHQSFEKKQWIDIAEAGLINYFKPAYNTDYKKAVYGNTKKSKFEYLYLKHVDKILIEFTPDKSEVSKVNGVVMYNPDICLKTKDGVLDVGEEKSIIECNLNAHGILSTKLSKQ